jgi:hypothetical protein
MERQQDKSVNSVCSHVQWPLFVQNGQHSGSDGSSSDIAEQGEIIYYHNTLPLLHDKLRMQPDRAQLFQFQADAPTVTMQRLKALTTGAYCLYLRFDQLFKITFCVPLCCVGGLPTFLDIKDNFDSPEISEDNLIHQMQRLNMSTCMMGDDTWVTDTIGFVSGSVAEVSFPCRTSCFLDRSRKPTHFRLSMSKIFTLLIMGIICSSRWNCI